MAFHIGLQDVSYDPDLHTGEVDFDFFDEPDPHSSDKKCELKNSTVEIKRQGCNTQDKIMLNGEEIQNMPSEDQDQSCKQRANLTDSREDEIQQNQFRGPETLVGQDRSSHSESHSSPEADSGSECQSASNSLSDAESGPGDLQEVARDMAVIEQSLQCLRVSSGAYEARLALPQHADTPPLAAEAPARARRPRPRSGCPRRKRWSSSLAEAALTARQIARLMRSDSDSSSSDMVGGSDSESDAGGRPAEVQTWLGGGRSEADAPSARPPAGGGRSAPAGRLGLLADAVRHLERTKPRTAPAATPRPVRAPTRKNMSFTNEEVRQIDRQNRILLNKIVAQQRRPIAHPAAAGGASRPRRSQKDQIRRDNLILLQKIRSARPSRSVISGFYDEPPPVRPILERGAVRHRRPWVDR